MLNIAISFLSIGEFGVDLDAYGVEEQVDQLVFMAMQNEFSEYDELTATTGVYDMIELYDDEGDAVDPVTINAPIRIAQALASIDWQQVGE